MENESRNRLVRPPFVLVGMAFLSAILIGVGTWVLATESKFELLEGFDGRFVGGSMLFVGVLFAAPSVVSAFQTASDNRAVMEITSGILTREQIEEEISETSDFLIRHGIAQVTVSFGWGCDADLHDLWKESQISPSQIDFFVDSEGSKVGFVAGKGDLFVESSEPSLKLHFCHDSDIHFSSRDSDIFLNLSQRWKAKNFPGFEKKNNKWVPILRKEVAEGC